MEHKQYIQREYTRNISGFQRALPPKRNSQKITQHQKHKKILFYTMRRAHRISFWLSLQFISELNTTYFG